MFAIELTFRKDKGASASALDAVYAYVGALQRNGNILKDSTLIVGDGGWVVYGVAPDKDAFRKPAQNAWVHRAHLRTVLADGAGNSDSVHMPGTSRLLSVCDISKY